ncbi:MAG: 16S rRNA (cytosine(967)-C(5))-methyltransferase RsmB [Lachnospiraceae bacterium]|nr:16S rRNA (cytosine(967)-C(5))-methyltransferase RsmB [Lachnospiraceae bacterium]
MTEAPDCRELALGILMEVTRQEEYSHIAIRNVLEKYQYLGKQERAFLTRLTEGTLEWMIHLDYIINQFSSVKINKMKPVIRNLLRMSVYQLKFMDSVPASAVCNEAVKLAGRKGFKNLKGFVNGVLRNIARNLLRISYPNQTDTSSYLSVMYSMPEWILEDWLTVYGAETTERMLRAFLEKEPLSIRPNLEKISPEELQSRLEQQGIKASKALWPDYALRIEHYNYLGAIPEFRMGLFQVQDVSSMLAVEAAAPKEGDVCIDVCAAPGGKSLHLAEKLHGTGRVEARDLTEYKADLIRQNGERSGVKNLWIRQWDACICHEESLGAADVVLADLPCSGLGVLGKKTDLKYRMTREQQEELALLQRQILGVVQAYVKPGGTLIYSTCTINPQENEENADWFLKHFPFEAVPLKDCLPKEVINEEALKGRIQLLPGIHGCDGFFIAKFRRNIES